MMRTRLTATVAIIVGVVFTVLLLYGHLGQASYVTLVSLTALVALAVAGFDRIRVIDLKSLKLTLEEHRSRIEEIEFGQHIADARAQVIQGKSLRFEDIQEEKAVAEHLPELQALADKYVNVRESDWEARVRRKNELAVTMASHVLSTGIPKRLLADQDHEGLLMALAATVYVQPEADDFALLRRCFRRVHQLHVRWRIVACIEKMLRQNLVRPTKRASIIEVLDLYGDGADRPLSLKIRRTRAILEDRIREQRAEGDAVNRAP